MFTTRPEIRGTFGVIASTHWLASAAGMGALERGGNAFDAAVTAGLVLQVVEPHLNGPGGDMPALLYDTRKAKVEVLCGQGTTPQAATIEHLTGMGLKAVPGNGLLAACVPGATDAWLVMLRDWGSIGLEDALAPAISYAEHGYPLVARIAATIDTVREMFLTEWKTSAALYLPQGQLPAAGHLFRNPMLAQTYKRLVAEAKSAGGDRVAQIEAARRAWRQGFVAEAIDKFCRDNEIMDSSGQRHRGLLSGADMAKWQPHVEAPVSVDYRGHQVFKCGAWSQGPAGLQQLKLLEGFDLAGMDPTGPDFVHALTETAKLAFADREAWYGDPDFVDVPLKALLSDEYASERRKLIGAQASLALRPGAPAGRPPRMADYTVIKAGGGAGLGEPTTGRLDRGHPAGEELPTTRKGVAAGDTCHVDVIDRHGNMVSATPSGGWLQSSPVIPALGFCLGTRAQMFWLERDLPASLAPGKRPRTTLSPGLAFRDGEPYMVFGTPGGDQQEQWQVQLLARHIDQGMNLQEAIDAPAFHTDHIVSSFYPRKFAAGALTIEGRFPEATAQELRRRGHALTVGEDWSEGRLSAAAREKSSTGPILKAAANPRGQQGYAVGR